jgi:hypothetical protein
MHQSAETPPARPVFDRARADYELNLWMDQYRIKLSSARRLIFDGGGLLIAPARASDVTVLTASEGS